MGTPQLIIAVCFLLGALGGRLLRDGDKRGRLLLGAAVALAVGGALIERTVGIVLFLLGVAGMFQAMRVRLDLGLNRQAWIWVAAASLLLFWGAALVARA